jgi:hypothetical protein
MDAVSRWTPAVTGVGYDVGALVRSSRCDTSVLAGAVGSVHDIDLSNPGVRQVMLGCLHDLAGCPAPALPELVFRLLQQRLINEV